MCLGRSDLKFLPLDFKKNLRILAQFSLLVAKICPSGSSPTLDDMLADPSHCKHDSEPALFIGYGRHANFSLIDRREGST